MSRKTDPPTVVPNSIDTLIGAGMRVEGDIASTGVLRVQGTVLGNVSCDCGPGGFLVVDSAGAVTGTINTTRLSVRGQVTGPVQSSQSIEIHAGATVAGDVSFRNMAIHAGGIVDGLLKPAAALDGDGLLEGQALPRSATNALPMGHDGDRSFMEKFGTALKFSTAIVVTIAVVTGAWINRDLIALSAPADGVPPEAHAPAKDTAILKTPPVPGDAPRSEPQAVAGDAASLASSASVGTPPYAPQADAAASQGKEVSVRGANPSRSASVFLLIGNQPAVLYKKKRDEPGDGTRITVAKDEKVSVSIAADEQVRVAEGRDVVILYQGQKVARSTIESGAWINFVPR